MEYQNNHLKSISFEGEGYLGIVNNGKPENSPFLASCEISDVIHFLYESVCLEKELDIDYYLFEDYCSALYFNEPLHEYKELEKKLKADIKFCKANCFEGDFESDKPDDHRIYLWSIQDPFSNKQSSNNDFLIYFDDPDNAQFVMSTKTDLFWDKEDFVDEFNIKQGNNLKPNKHTRTI